MAYFYQLFVSNRVHKVDIDVLSLKRHHCRASLKEFTVVTLNVVFTDNILTTVICAQSSNYVREIKFWHINEGNLRVDENVSRLTQICGSNCGIVSYELLWLNLLVSHSDDCTVENPFPVGFGPEHLHQR